MKSTSGSKSKLFDFDSVRLLDSDSIGEFDMPEKQLMGQAALASFYALLEHDTIPDADGPGRIFFFAGPGNNGGDALALACHIISFNENYADKISIFRAGESRSETSKYYATRLSQSGVIIHQLTEDFVLPPMGKKDLIIEGLLGTGQKGSVRSPMKELLGQIAKVRQNTNRPILVALDLPAGLTEEDSVFFSDPGQSHTGDLPAPDFIHSYGVDRLAVRLNPQLASSSTVIVLPMGFHPVAIGRRSSNIELSTKSNLPDRFLKRSTDHKYSAGHGLLIGGSSGMEGALMMAQSAFFASGGGILHSLAANEKTRTILLSDFPSVMFLPVDESIPDIKFPGAIGAGVGLSVQDRQRIRNYLFEFLGRMESESGHIPFIVLDAGGLEWVRDYDYRPAWKKRTLLTPHSGEWKRMGGHSIYYTEDFRKSESLAREMGCSVLVKDSVSVLFDNSGDHPAVSIISKPHPSLAIAGSGDSLTGILVAALARHSVSRMATGDSKSFSEVVTDSIHLHREAASLQLHPAAHQFPDLIREYLKLQRGE